MTVRNPFFSWSKPNITLLLKLCCDLNLVVINIFKCIYIRHFVCPCTKFDSTRALTRNLSSLRCYCIIVPPHARRFSSCYRLQFLYALNERKTNSMHLTHQLDLFPDHRVTQVLFKDVKNAAELRQNAVAGKISAALIKPTMVRSLSSSIT